MRGKRRAEEFTIGAGGAGPAREALRLAEALFAGVSGLRQHGDVMDCRDSVRASSAH
jgi:hypothetical protein